MSNSEPNLPWWRHLNRYHWYVFTLCALGWLFDTMDQMIFTSSRSITMRDLMPDASIEDQRKVGGYVTSIFILGWATGGLIFGVVGDKWGRAKTMALTIFIYAAFTGLSSFSRTPFEFGVFRFLTGLGVGGEFAAGAALLSEVMPDQARARALGMLQALSAIGNITGAALLWFVEPVYGWKALYYVGAIPALLSVFVRMRLKEPEKWLEARRKAAESGAEQPRMGRMSDLFTPRWIRNTLVGLSLGIAGVLGLWGAGFFSPELMDASIPVVAPDAHEKFEVVARASAADQLAVLSGLTSDEAKSYKDLVSRRLKLGHTISADKALTTPLNEAQAAQLRELLDKSLSAADHTRLKAKGLILQQIGAFFGIMGFSVVAARLGRRPAFLIAFLLAWFSVVFVFLNFNRADQVWYMYPLLGFGTLAPFGGYAVYFPELFPTRLRTTGTGFCYNVGRYVSSLGPFALPWFAAILQGKFEVPGFRLAAVVISFAYGIGILALIWAPETLDKPLPQD